MDIRELIYISWAAFFIIWAIWGITAKKIKRRQSAVSRARQAVLLIFGFWLLFSPVFRSGPLAWKILPHSAATEGLAIIFTFAGFALAIWARFHLGANWSAIVTVKHDHGLVKTGPYAFVRHPIYTGLSLSALGLARSEER